MLSCVRRDRSTFPVESDNVVLQYAVECRSYRFSGELLNEAVP